MKYFVGIDPGKTGAWAVLEESGYLFETGMNESLSDLIHTLSTEPLRLSPVLACVEKSHAMPGQGSVSMFTFGEQFGIIQGILKALMVPYELVASNRWQKTVMDMLPAKATASSQESEKDASKRRSANRAALKQSTVDFVLRRYPQLEPRLKFKKNQGIADAICIALYAMKRTRA